MKLSNKEKEVVISMRGGSIMFVPHPYFVRPSNKIVMRTGSDYREINKRTFCSLRSKGIIYQHKYEHSDSSIYKLTKLGKTIKINQHG